MNLTNLLSIDRTSACRAIVEEAANAVCQRGAEAALADAKERLEDAPSLQDSLSLLGHDRGVDLVVTSPSAVARELGTNQQAPRPFLGPASEVGQEAAMAALAEVPSKLSGLNS